MSKFPISEYKPVEGVNVRIVDQGEVVTVDYQGSMTKHTGSLWWGTAVGYRAMQVAAIALSEENLWDRKGLIVASGHPGPGVIDSLNYVTKCVDTDSCTIMQNPNCVNRCNSEMKFEWWVCDGEKTAHVMLSEDFVPRDFYELIDRRVYNEKTPEDDRLFELYKVNLSTRLWNAPLEENFSYEYMDPIKVGEIPTGHEWSLAAK
jgi:hypothetical protein